MSIHERVIQDLEILLHLQRKYIWTLEKTNEAYVWLMHWYNDFINDYDAKLLKVGKELAAGDKRERKAAKTTEKIRGKIRELLPKNKRRYGPTKHTKKSKK